MIREILFRAKRIDNGEWVSGYYVYDYAHNAHFIFKNQLVCPNCINDRRIDYSVCDYEIDPDTFCQYTGLTDKNGKRIWENDIVEDKRFNGFYKIVFRVRDGGWYVENINSGALFRIIERTSCQYERCGNIFDTPELMKGGLTCRN